MSGHAHLSVRTDRSPDRRFDDVHMRRALDLAWRAVGQTEPNPMVGSVAVLDGAVVGEGYHRRCGGAHAETIALRSAGERAAGATLYVSLEPCAHYGRTPPCVDEIIASGVRRVVIPTFDPDARVLGRGAQAMRRAGIRVDVGVLAPLAVLQNLSYYRDRLELGPTITLKMATTMDGKIASAPGRRDDITGLSARRYVHQLRSAHDCVVVGIDTALVDRPTLDCRYLETTDTVERRQPVPVVLDTHLRLNPENQWSARNRRYVVLCAEGADRGRARALERRGARVVSCHPSDSGVAIDSACHELAAIGFNRIMVEGGSGVFTSFARRDAWDAFYLFQSAALFGAEGVTLYRGESSREIDALMIDAMDVDGDTLHRFINVESLKAILSRVENKGE